MRPAELDLSSSLAAVSLPLHGCFGDPLAGAPSPTTGLFQIIVAINNAFHGAIGHVPVGSVVRTVRSK